jgi:AbrB family looped-hinge helix DNA binding protein
MQPRKVKAMQAVKISSKYQIVIPREIRDQFDLGPGQKSISIQYKGKLHPAVRSSIEKAGEMGVVAGLPGLQRYLARPRSGWQQPHACQIDLPLRYS